MTCFLLSKVSFFEYFNRKMQVFLMLSGKFSSKTICRRIVTENISPKSFDLIKGLLAIYIMKLSSFLVIWELWSSGLIERTMFPPSSSNSSNKKMISSQSVVLLNFSFKSTQLTFFTDCFVIKVAYFSILTRIFKF